MKRKKTVRRCGAFSSLKRHRQWDEFEILRSATDCKLSTDSTTTYLSGFFNSSGLHDRKRHEGNAISLIRLTPVNTCPLAGQRNLPTRRERISSCGNIVLGLSDENGKNSLLAGENVTVTQETVKRVIVCDPRSLPR